jgi:expansin (peptidoglycan-binding protein)
MYYSQKWVMEDYYHVAHPNQINLQHWRYPAIDLGYKQVVDYIEFLKANYTSVRIRINTNSSNKLVGLLIDFKDKTECDNLAQLLNERGAAK